MVRQGHGVALARLAFNRLVLLRLAPMASVVTRRALAAIRREEAGRPCVILCSTMDWTVAHRHRPHHLARALAAAGVTVFYVPARTGYDSLLGIRKCAPHLYLADLTDDLLASIDRAVVILLSTDVRIGAALLDALRRRGVRLVYDYIDCFDSAVTLLPLSAVRRAVHEQLLRDEAVLVVGSAQALVNEVRALRTQNVVYLPNGVDCAHFSVARRRRRFHLVFEAALSRRSPVIGFFGLLAGWVDVDLIAALARARPDLTVVTIGPDYDGTGARLAASRPANLFMVPSVPYDELPDYAAWFDVSILPFLRNPITDAASPLKLFEYMALGAPIVSTTIPEAMRYPSVTVAENREAFIDACARAATQAEPAAQREQRIAGARANAWNVRATDLIAALDRAGFLDPAASTPAS